MEKLEYTVTDFHSPDTICRGTLADLVIDALIIPRCGFIPPFSVLRSILRAGGHDGGMGTSCIWQPLELTENDYWQLMEKLAEMPLEDFKFRHRDPNFISELRPDYDAPNTDNYLVWLDSLIHRGHLPGKPSGKMRR